MREIQQKAYLGKSSEQGHSEYLRVRELLETQNDCVIKNRVFWTTRYNPPERDLDGLLQSKDVNVTVDKTTAWSLVRAVKNGNFKDVVYPLQTEVQMATLFSAMGFVQMSPSYWEPRTKVRTQDVRVRDYEDRWEILCRLNSDNVADPDREDISIQLNDKSQLLQAQSWLSFLGWITDPPWKKTKSDFLVPKDDSKYTVSLQHIDGEIAELGYVIEVKIHPEYTITKDQVAAHLANERIILDAIGLVPAGPDFMDIVRSFIAANQNAKLHR